MGSQRYAIWDTTHHEAVKALVLKDYPHFPEYNDMGGVGIVAECDGKVNGFVWCMLNERARLGNVDFFVVDQEFRHSNQVGPMLMYKLFSVLFRLGVKRIYGTLVSGTGYDISLARVYSDVGMDLTPAAFHVQGDTLEILKGIARRYEYGRIENNSDNNSTTSNGRREKVDINGDGDDSGHLG